jgi:hypothetical protein
MTTQASLNEAELSIILELLETERRNLPSMIRRTEFNVEADDYMHRRQEIVEDLVTKLRNAEAKA